MTKKYGLPTYPIHDRMQLGNRDRDEIGWLIDHGVLQSDLLTYKKIIQRSPSQYELYQHVDGDASETFLKNASNVLDLLEGETVPTWYWVENDA